MTRPTFGVPVITSRFLPEREPTPAEDARRIVRHGLADVLDWLDEPVGPAPGEPVRTAFLLNMSLLRSQWRFGFMVNDPRPVVRMIGGA